MARPLLYGPVSDRHRTSPWKDVMRLAKLTAPSRIANGLWTMTSLASLATVVACAGGVPPQLDGLTDQVAQVGTELKIDLNGTSAGGGQLSYNYHAGDLTD